MSIEHRRELANRIRAVADRIETLTDRSIQPELRTIQHELEDIAYRVELGERPLLRPPEEERGTVMEFSYQPLVNMTYAHIAAAIIFMDLIGVGSVLEEALDTLLDLLTIERYRQYVLAKNANRSDQLQLPSGDELVQETQSQLVRRHPAWQLENTSATDLFALSLIEDVLNLDAIRGFSLIEDEIELKTDDWDFGYMWHAADRMLKYSKLGFYYRHLLELNNLSDTTKEGVRGVIWGEEARIKLVRLYNNMGGLSAITYSVPVNYSLPAHGGNYKMEGYLSCSWFYLGDDMRVNVNDTYAFKRAIEIGGPPEFDSDIVAFCGIGDKRMNGTGLAASFVALKGITQKEGGIVPYRTDTIQNNEHGDDNVLAEMGLVYKLTSLAFGKYFAVLMAAAYTAAAALSGAQSIPEGIPDAKEMLKRMFSKEKEVKLRF